MIVEIENPAQIAFSHGRQEFEVSGDRYATEVTGTLLDGVYTVYRYADGDWIKCSTRFAQSGTDALRKHLRIG